jgi:uncharacterized SAM-binding protein YcdF (DUF218 family)
MNARAGEGTRRSRSLRAICAALCLLIAPGGIDPARAAEPVAAEAPLPETAVVFTGARNRVLWALRLLEDGRIARLLISGIPEEMFLREFRLSRVLAEARRDGRLVLGTRAESTLENAAETVCWLKQQGLSGPLLLITSEDHLPRAMAALANAAPDLAVTPLGVSASPGRATGDPDGSERAKLALTQALRFLPRSVGVRAGFEDCSAVEFR